MNRKSYVIFDIDNCIADERWRRHTIRSGNVFFDLRWHDYHMLSCFDEPANKVPYLQHRQFNNIAIFTSRFEQYRSITEEWLKRNGFVYDRLRMRPNSTYRPSAELKGEWAAELMLESYVDVVHAYDDQASVISAYSVLGLNTTLLAIDREYSHR